MDDVVPPWLTYAAYVTLAAGFLCTAVIAYDIFIAGYRQRMKVMEAVWPSTALYFGPVALFAYFRWGRLRSVRTEGDAEGAPQWQTAALGATHCGAGCTMGDLAGAWIVFAAALAIAGSTLLAEYAVDFAIAYLAGIAFQYFAIAPMRGFGFRKGLTAAVKADTLSLAAFEVGMFAWMAVVQLLFFPSPHLTPDHAAYWFMMQVAMIAGFFTTLPVNAWLIRRGIKEAM